MTNILLTIIAVLLFARIVLQVRQGKRAVEKGYAAPSEVEYFNDICDKNSFTVARKARELGKDGWELTTIMPIDIKGNEYYTLFFTRKKIKNYYD